MENTNIKKIVLLTIIISLGFLTPVEVIFFSYKGLALSQIYFLYSIFSIFIFLLEVPTGYIGDKIGYKNSISVGLCFGIIGMIGFILGKGFILISISYFFMALMTSFISGSDDALIYDLLLEEGKENEFMNVYSKIASYGYMITMLGGILGGIIAKFNILLNPILDGICFILGIIIMFFIKQPRNSIKEKEQKKEEKYGFRIILNECKDVLPLLFIAGIFMTSTLVGMKFSQPLMLEAGIPLVYFGIFTAICSIINSVASYFTNKLNKNSFGFITLLPSITIVFIGISKNGWTVILLFITAICRAVGNIVITSELNKNISSKYRATINSLKSLIFRIFYSIVILIMGGFSNYDVFFSLLIGGGILVFSMSILLMIYKLKFKNIYYIKGKK